MQNLTVTAPASSLVEIAPNANLIVVAQTVAVDPLLSQEPLAHLANHKVCLLFLISISMDMD